MNAKKQLGKYSVHLSCLVVSMENEFSQFKNGLSKHDSQPEFQNPPLTKYYLEIPAQNADLSLLLEKPRTYEQIDWQQYKPNLQSVHKLSQHGVQKHFLLDICFFPSSLHSLLCQGKKTITPSLHKILQQYFSQGPPPPLPWCGGPPQVRTKQLNKLEQNDVAFELDVWHLPSPLL